MSISSARLRIIIFEIPPNEEACLRQPAVAEQDLFFHSAFNSGEALNRVLNTTVANILAFAAGKPINIVRD